MTNRTIYRETGAHWLKILCEVMEQLNAHQARDERFDAEMCKAIGKLMYLRESMLSAFVATVEAEVSADR